MLSLFNVQSLKHLLHETGFTNVTINTPGKLDAELVRKAILNGSYKPNNSFIEEVLINQYDKVGHAFQSFLAENNLSSHMWAYAQKPGKE